MVQLILDVFGDPIELPESKKGGYKAERKDLSVDLEMVTGRMVSELRGTVWTVLYQYGYFDGETKNKVIATAERGKTKPIQCAFLPPDSTGALKYSKFFVTDFTHPKFMWSHNINGLCVPIWGDFAISLREVEPSD